MARLSIKDLEIERNDELLEIEMSDGSIISFKDPKAIPYEELLTFDPTNPAKALRLVIDSDFDEFAKNPEVDGYFLDAIFRRYTAHFALPSSGEAGA